VNPTFVIDRIGEYRVSLVVTDSKNFSSQPDEVLISTSNSAPTAEAGSPQTVHVGIPVSLDGSVSSDPDGDKIDYAWSIVSIPSGSNANLSGDATYNPSITPDVPGNYVIRLVVIDKLGSPSAPDEVTISTLNSKPVAEAGSDQSIIVLGTTVNLNGSQSYDLDGDPIAYQWAMTSRPSGSAASLLNPSSVKPSFVADIQGSYIFQLVVRDPWTPSEPDTVTVSFANVAPVAEAGLSRSVRVGDVVALDGSGSADANHDQLTFMWSLNPPAGSSAQFDDCTTVRPSFVPDMAGSYVATLAVNDGVTNSAPDSVTITATPLNDEIIQKLNAVIDCINAIPSDHFKNKNMKKTLANKLNAVIEDVDRGYYEDALNKLEHDILAKMDGCANGGSPDKNDWITTCASQACGYQLIWDAIYKLEDLLR
jgi:hypothetical protein